VKVASLELLGFAEVSFDLFDSMWFPRHPDRNAFNSKINGNQFYCRINNVGFVQIPGTDITWTKTLLFSSF